MHYSFRLPLSKDVDCMILCKASKGILIVDLRGQDELSFMNEFRALIVAKIVGGHMKGF